MAEYEAYALLPESLESLAREKAAPAADADLPAVEALISGAGLVRVNGTVRAGADQGLGVLPVLGPIWSRVHWQALALDFGALMDDPNIRAIVIDVDSPGGLLTGTQEFAELVYQARGRKPITAFIGGMGASAAYWVASAADEVVIGETGQAGSIGIQATYIDWSGFDEQLGIRQIDVISSQSPDKNRPPTDPKGRDLAQVRVDDLAAVFIEHVARNRGVSAQTVQQRFGQGDVLVGRRAIEAGLADRLGTFEALVAGGARGAQLSWVEKNVAAEHRGPYLARITAGKGLDGAATEALTRMQQQESTMQPSIAAPSSSWAAVVAKFRREHEQREAARTDAPTEPPADPHGWGKIAAKFGGRGG